MESPNKLLTPSALFSENKMIFFHYLTGFFGTRYYKANMSFCPALFKQQLNNYHLFFRSLRDHSSITSAKRWVGGVRKWQLLLIYSTIYADVVGWVGLKKPKICWRNTWMVPYQPWKWQPVKWAKVSSQSYLKSHW